MRRRRSESTVPQWTVAAAVGLFLVAMTSGWLVNPVSFADATEVVVVPLLDTALHNLRIIAILVAGGFLLGIPTIPTAFWNGFITGALFAGTTPNMWAFLLVHAVPELTGQFAATVSGLELGRQVVGRVAHDRPMQWRPAVKWAVVAGVLTVIAAALESLVTPVVASFMLPLGG